MKRFADPNFPTRAEIRRAFNRKLPGGYLLQEYFEPLAEEAENLMLRWWRSSKGIMKPVPEEVPEIVTVILRNSVYKCKHYCTNCKSKSVHYHHKYCPHCGLKIEWKIKKVA